MVNCRLLLRSAITSRKLSFLLPAPLTLAISQALALKALMGKAEPSAAFRIALEIRFHFKGFSLLLCSLPVMLLLFSGLPVLSAQCHQLLQLLSV